MEREVVGASPASPLGFWQAVARGLAAILIWHDADRARITCPSWAHCKRWRSHRDSKVEFNVYSRPLMKSLGYFAI